MARLLGTFFFLEFILTQKLEIGKRNKKRSSSSVAKVLHLRFLPSKMEKKSLLGPPPQKSRVVGVFYSSGPNEPSPLGAEEWVGWKSEKKLKGKRVFIFLFLLFRSRLPVRKGGRAETVGSEYGAKWRKR
jgi:hypothetical protein